MYKDLHIGFLGLGKMGSAIAGGLLKKEPKLQLHAFDIMGPGAKDSLNAIRFHESPRSLEDHCDIILLCVKPQDMKKALGGFQGDKKYISIAAGLNLAALQTYFDASRVVQVARVMPNISALIAESVSAVYSEDPELLKIATSIFNDVGFALEVQKEELMNSVTALSGSGPAFVFAFMQALAEGGVLRGLPYDTALKLAAHTIRGAAGLLIEGDEHPDVLRNQVTSPGGTTIAGLMALEKGGFHGTVMAAVDEAARRSEELGS